MSFDPGSEPADEHSRDGEQGDVLWFLDIPSAIGDRTINALSVNLALQVDGASYTHAST